MVVQLSSSFTFACMNEFAMYCFFRRLTTTESFDTPTSRQSYINLSSEKLSFESFTEPDIDELEDENHEEMASLSDVFTEKVKSSSTLPSDSFSLDSEENREVRQISDSDSWDELSPPPTLLISSKPSEQTRFVRERKPIDFYRSVY